MTLSATESADENARRAAILASPSYRLAQSDIDFLALPELRPVRLQLELLKPEMTLAQYHVQSTIVLFGGTHIVEREIALSRLAAAQKAYDDSPHDPHLLRAVTKAHRIVAKSKYYDAAREFARIVSSTCQRDGRCEYVIATGGGPGIMEAGNRGAHDVEAKSVGLNITLPAEQVPNPYITPELCFQFHYFALRKMHFLMRAKALIAFPGGYGTMDELFDALTLRQTGKLQQIPIILFGREYWQNVVNFQYLADEGVISDEHLELVSYSDSPEDAWQQIARFHNQHHLASPPAKP